MVNISVKNKGVKPCLYNYWKKYIFDAVKDFSHLFKLKTTINIFFEKSRNNFDNMGGFTAAETRHKRNNIYIISVYDKALAGRLDDDEIDAVLFHEICHIVDMINVSSAYFNPDKIKYTIENEAIMDIGFSFWTETFAYYMTNRFLKFKNSIAYKDIVREYERLLKEKETLPSSYPENISSAKKMSSYMKAGDVLLNRLAMYMAYHLNSAYQKQMPLIELCQELQPVLQKMIEDPYNESIKENLTLIGEAIIKKYHNSLGIELINTQNNYELVYYFKKNLL